MKTTKNDIATPTDINILVEAFYEKIRSQPYLCALFEHLSPRDWNQHLFQMKNFWDSVLLKSATYTGHPLILHAFLPDERAQVKQWIHLFQEAVEEHFTGPTAATAQTLANKIRRVFAYPSTAK
ncbi:group III truncated hemoglobin [Adhaeribacter radiodurans]|uniref:Group III truncated hemoglobin n=1 Tax=Adhaeribacter radiodurans TaxID=2745197 RepID=A0A7L7L1I4_9BACT|nr:group III truncated hemoglobin [Adhaeribacter radiodurans]QMU26647.1 group III truncated hemoglobin [Adhaeribacter radiodurans]